MNIARSGLLLVLAASLTPPVVVAAAHTYLFGCDACHTPNNEEVMPDAPLWDGGETTTTLAVYAGETFRGTLEGQPVGDSKLCLSCHDGSNSDYAWMHPSRRFGAGELAGSHPISFVYDSALAEKDGALKDPSEASTLGGTIFEDLLDPYNRVYCGSCHDVHSSSVGNSLLRGYDFGSRHGPGLCRMCHMK